jgi:hypothetical protein
VRRLPRVRQVGERDLHELFKRPALRRGVRDLAERQLRSGFAGVLPRPSCRARRARGCGSGTSTARVVEAHGEPTVESRGTLTVSFQPSTGADRAPERRSRGGGTGGPSRVVVISQISRAHCDGDVGRRPGANAVVDEEPRLVVGVRGLLLASARNASYGRGRIGDRGESLDRWPQRSGSAGAVADGALEREVSIVTRARVGQVVAAVVVQRLQLELVALGAASSTSTS